jgi:3-oxoadipate enol-lactonase
MPELKRKNGSIYWDLRGEGEPLVILRGLGRTVRHWLGYDEELAKSFLVLTMDLRGVGRSTERHGWTDSIFTLADDVADVMTAAKIERAHVLGVSLGGMVTLAMGLAHPERCKSLITVNTSIARQGTLRMSVPGVAGIARGLMAGGDQIHKNLARAMVGDQTGAEDVERIARQFAEIAASDGMNIDTVLRQLVAAARFNVARRLKRCDVPALVVYGTADAFVPTVNSKKVARHLKNARLVAIEGGGHELTLDKGPELKALVESWVAEQANAAR